MKINLSFNKNKENKNRNKNGDTNIDNDQRNNKSYKENNPTTRNKIETIFSMSDEEETINYENTHNKIIQREKENKLNDEIKEYIKEHEEPGLSNYETKEDRRERMDENKKKKIQYLGYKSNELTKINNSKIDDKDYPYDEKDIYDNFDEKEKKKKKKKSIEQIDKDSDEYYKKNYKYHKKYSSSHENNDRDNSYDKDRDIRNKIIDKKKIDMKKYDKHIEDYEKQKKKNEYSDDDINKSYLCIDDIFKKKENTDEKKKSKYMEALINSAKRRELEKEFLIQKKQKIDTEKEEKVFITSAYKKKLMDRELIKKDMDLEVEEKKVEKSSNYNLNLFLKNINAPSNYNRYNRR
ncbi:conserved Plasmodium protein, unknown function [Plasmodium sp. gorilla clade G2]|uniref:conserved Plasmodium protein, unknown function n=1 Tax=Plasmodium sp. gorilla clade G2 TaxID=880535 RepID=UPI000D214AE5|nr:conserved Plasmodium protein, unknown function [Plasmodium sp. gorilla clade G2]SOV18469.1 conserved Plasmodium protein, unknown function [Plasmodium sp. gorilla clade G2]